MVTRRLNPALGCGSKGKSMRRNVTLITCWTAFKKPVYPPGGVSVTQRFLTFGSSAAKQNGLSECLVSQGKPKYVLKWSVTSSTLLNSIIRVSAATYVDRMFKPERLYSLPPLVSWVKTCICLYLCQDVYRSSLHSPSSGILFCRSS